MFEIIYLLLNTDEILGGSQACDELLLAYNVVVIHRVVSIH